MIHIRHERMSDAFEKFHILGLPFPMVLHHFSEPDLYHPHDHPWGFRSTILQGGYVEEIFNKQGESVRVTRNVGDSFEIPAEHIHRIPELLTGDCWTQVIPGPDERTSRFWDFREDGSYSRAWHEIEWTKEISL